MADIIEPFDPNNPGPYIVDGESGDAGKFEPGIDDLNQPLKTRLGDYLSRNTIHGHDNGYSPTRGNEYTVPLGSNEFTLSDADGYPVPIVTAGGSSSEQNVFAPVAGDLDTAQKIGSQFAETESGGLTLGQLLTNRRVGDTPPYTGNTFLKDGVAATGLNASGQSAAQDLIQPESTPVSNLVSQALLKNRWNPRRGETPFDPDGDRVGDASMPIAGFQKKLGEFDPEGEAITFEQLQNVGLSLMLMATGDDVDVNNPTDPTSATAKDRGAGANQMGIPRSYPQVDPSNAYGAPGRSGGAAPDDERPRVMAGNGVTNLSDGIAPFSFGSYNNFLDKFGNSDEATLALAGALALAVGVAVKPIQGIISALMEPVTSAEALARITPIGAMKIATRPGLPPVLNINDILARVDSAGKSPLIFTGRSSRRSLLLTPIPLEQLGIVVPDNQASLSGATRAGGPASGGGLAPPDGFAGDKFTLYTRTLEWGLLVMFFPGNVVQSPGYYITVARNVIRSSLNMAAVTVGQTGTVSPRRATELTSAANISATVNAGADVIAALLNSKMASFLNVMATIGNASLKHNPALLQIPLPEAINRGAPVLGPSGETIFPVPIAFLPQSYLDMMPANYAMSSKVGNSQGQGRGSGYRAGNATSMLILPDSFRAASARMNDLSAASSEAYAQKIIESTMSANSAGGKIGEAASIASLVINPGLYARTPSQAYGQMSSREGDPLGVGKTGNFRFENKIDTETREAVEAELEAEYMPFYFHDLRTNEIVSFQAFLEQLADNYSVAHAKTSAYGRIDDIMIYQKTTRSISVGFTIACTNHADFEIMYAKINKLVTLIYPQWSPGRVVMSEGGVPQKIVAPFSQIPTSSPVIRLRLGDIIRRNGSKFNLLRLFGVGTENFSLNPKSEAIGNVLASIDSISAQAGSIPAVQTLINNLAGQISEMDTDFANFTDSDRNPVLKSFKAVGGKGLAGVITSMNFDWLGGNSWEVARYGSRAPKICKVTIAFSPIHDIAPGIDADGMNRAPIYPVGDTMSAVAGQTDDSAGREKFNDTKTAVDDVLNKMIDKSGIVDYT